MSATSMFPSVVFGRSEVSPEARRELECQCAELAHQLTIHARQLRAEVADQLAAKLDKNRQILRAGLWPRRPGEPPT